MEISMELQQIALIITVGSDTWLVAKDGSWTLANPQDLLTLASLNVPQMNLSVNDVLFTNQQAYAELDGSLINIPDNILLSLAQSQQFLTEGVSSQKQAQNFTSSVVNENSAEGLNYFYQIIQNVNEELIAKSGFDTEAANESEIDYMADTNSQSGNNPVLSQLSITIIDGGDEFLNRFEVPSFSVIGEAEDLPNGYVLTISLIDIDDNELLLTATVNNEKFRVDDINITDFSEGLITATVFTTGEGVIASPSSDTSVKDTIAELNLEVTSTCTMQGETFSLVGSVIDIEDGQTVTVTVTDTLGNEWVEDVIINDGQYLLARIDTQIFKDGELTVTVESIDIPGNPAINNVTSFELDTFAQITINIEKTNDEVLNGSEDNTVTISGTASGVEDNQVVTVVIQDENNNQVTINAPVLNGEWRIEGVDLSSLDNGQLTATATVEDLHCNIASAADVVAHDKLAFIDIDVTSLCTPNGEVFSLSGVVTDIEDGQTVTVIVSDELGNELTESVVIDNGRYLLTNLDTSIFVDGELLVTVQSTDLAGNTAINSRTFELDSFAEITITIEKTSDEVLNSTEDNTATISGTAPGVEDNQVVTVVIQDENNNQVTINAPVLNGEWRVESVDLSSLDNGQLTATATVEDLHCNVASADDVVEHDKLADITLNFSASCSDNSQGYLFSGEVFDVEDANQVSLQLIDSQGNSLSYTTIVENGQWRIEVDELSVFFEGKFNATVSVTDNAGNVATVSEKYDLADIDDFAALTIEVETGQDQVINKLESSNTTIKGTVDDVENGQTVTVTLVDISGSSLHFTAQVVNQVWVLENVDISTLKDGNIAVMAEVEDLSCNKAIAETQFDKDTKAFITIDQPDQVINQFEIFQSNFSGTTNEIENGQNVNIRFTDSNGQQLVVNTLVANNLWEINDVDLSSLSDGSLTITAQASDLAGNPATASESSLINTLAKIDINIVERCVDNLEIIDLYGFVFDVDDAVPVSITITDSNGTQLSFVVNANNGTWSLKAPDISALVDGTLMITADVVDFDGNPASAQTTYEKDTLALITINIDSGDDSLLSAEEAKSTSIFGNVTDIEDGQTVSIVVSDINGDTVAFQTTVNNGQWRLDNVDLSQLSDGQLTATAHAEDLNCNLAEASDNTTIKDSQAEISIRTDGLGDGVINGDEITHVDLILNAVEIEVGQPALITVTDSIGVSQTYNTLVQANEWRVASLDFSLFAEGPLLISVTASDIAGNIAVGETDTFIDTLSSISVIPLTGGDGVINTQESNAVVIVGVANDIEAGNPVEVIVTDINGLQLTFNTAVEASSYIIRAADLSSLADGLLTFEVSSIDREGNPATNTNSAIKNTEPVAITIDIDTLADDTINFVESTQVDISGTTSNVEDGAEVEVVLIDSASNELVFTALVNNNSWNLSDIDVSSLVDGAVTGTASVTNSVGNLAQASEQVNKNVVAELTITPDIANLLLNAAEVSNVTISGTATDIEDNQAVLLMITDSLNNTVQASTQVNSGQWQINNLDLSNLVDGLLSIEATSEDIYQNSASAFLSNLKDTQASITVVIDDADQLINAIEQNSVSLYGETANIENGRQVNIIITDADGATSEFTAVNISNGWQLDNLDLSSLAQGAFTVDVSASDLAGNIATASTTAAKDTEATITIEVDTGTDNIINAQESLSTLIFGTVESVEDGQTVTVLVSDGTLELEFSATVNSAQWQIVAADLSSLSDGTLTYLASTVDLSGNEATAQTNSGKDTQALITVQIDSGDDQYLDSSELTGVVISGQTTFVEVNQPIQVTLSDSDGNEIVTDTTVTSDGSWSIPAQDLSTWAQGIVTANVSVTDLAGNTATNNDTATIDTQAFIDIDTSSGFNVADFRAGLLTSLSGTTDAEVGNIVTLDLVSSINDVEDARIQLFGSVVSSGVWLVDNIDITSLPANSVWNLTASVTDNAGNFASDEMPDLDIIQQQVLYELVLDVSDSTSASSLLDIDNASLTLATMQTALASLTSLTNPVRVDVSPDQLSLQVYQLALPEALAMEVTLVGTELTVTTYLAFDEPIDSEFLLTEVIVEATQVDTDTTSETVQLPITIKIFDTPPFLFDDDYSLEEAQTHQGSLLGNDFTIEGPLVVTQVTFAGSIYTIPAGGEVTFNSGYGQLTVNALGAWQLIADGDIDNTIDPSFELTYQAIDQDGSVNDATATFTIIDGDAGFVNDIKVESIEPDYNKTSINSVDINISAGSDSLVADSVIFNSETINAFDGLGLTSDGFSLSYSTSLDNKQIFAEANGQLIFSIELSAVEDGRNLIATAEVFQQGPLDNIYSDSITFPIIVEALDLDGTAVASGDLLFTSLDGDNPYIEDVSGVTVSENDLTASTPVEATGSLSSFIGSDQLTSVFFSDINQQPQLTSDGIAIQYELQANDGRPDKILIAHTGDIADPVFKVALTSNFSDSDDTLNEPYVFTLYRAFDQSVSEDVNIAIELSDFDGDVVNQSLNIRVLDDGEAIITTPDLSVTEIPRVVGSTLTNIALGQINITANSDRIVDIDYDVSDGDPVLDANGQAITHNGEAITWLNVGAGKLYGQLSDGTQVFRIKLPSDLSLDPEQSTSIAISVTIREAIDHLGIQDSMLSVAVPVVLIDQDGSQFVDVMQVNVDDGLNPSLPSPASADNSVDEHELLSKDKIKTSGNITLTPGSDDIVSLTLADSFSLSGITTRDGVNVTLNSTANGKGWFIAKADDNNQEVFRIKFNADGSFEYIQRQAIDHPDAAGTNDLIINFQVQAVDSDGDKSSAQTVSVTVVDDIPDADPQAITIIEGQTGTLDIFDDQQGGADGASLSKITYLGSDYFVGDTITLIDTSQSPSVSYGSATFTSDGIITFTTEKYSSTLPSFDDAAFVYEITDADGDIATESIVVTIKDSEGGVIFAPLTTNEDDALNLIFAAGLGDADEGEYINELRINIADLNGGDLVFTNAAGNVEALPEVGGYYILSRSQLIVSSGSLLFPDGAAIANGTLTFTPALNTSDAIPSQIVSLTVQVQVNNSDDTEKVVVENSKEITINSVADLPVWNNTLSTYDYNDGFDDSIVEDGAPVMINLTAELFDTDSSEQLTYRIENIDENLTLTVNDGSATQVEELDILTQAQLDTLQATSPENFAGVLTFEVIAIATENDNNDTIEREAKLITVYVQPVADPVDDFTVKKVNSIEDNPINLNGVISASLTDLDGSETLSYLISLPNSDWSINPLGGAVITDLGGNVWSVLAEDVDNSLIEIIPQQDISSFTLGPDNPDGTFNIGVKAVATESIVDGVPVSGSAFETSEKVFTVYLAGLVDQPAVDVGTHWQYDDTTFTISNTSSFDEDQDIPLDFLIQSGDIDGSEEINLLVTSLPDNLIFVDNLGNEVNLDVVEVINNSPVYAVSASDLQTLSVRPTEDFSGLTQVGLAMIVTDPLGNTERFELSVDITISPVIDQTPATLMTNVEGIEDQVTILDLTPSLDADLDGSEEITEVTITGLAAGSRLTLDGQEYAFTGSLALSTLLDASSPTLASLLASGRIGVIAPKDASGNFDVSLDYTVVDTSPQGDSLPTVLSSTVQVYVRADVDITTVINSVPGVLTSNGEAIDLTGKVNFSDGDTDGSEVLQYIVLTMPDITGWYVFHPNGALPDGEGNWRIPISASLTSNTLVEDQVDLLAGVTIVSENATGGPVTIEVSGRVLDADGIYTDKEMVNTSFEVDFTAGAPISEASPVSVLQNTVIDAVEDQAISTSGHLNSNIAGDGNDLISFRILTADLPAGVVISGPGVKVIHYNNGFTRKEYVFDQDALSTLSISSAGDNFAGILNIPIRIIATDTLSGDTLIDDSQSLSIDVTPVVDEVTAETANDFIYEDSTGSIDLSFVFTDNDLTASTGGVEQIVSGDDVSKNLVVTLPAGASLIDPSGLFQLQGGSTWQFTGNTSSQLQAALVELGINPPQHLSGEDIITVDFSGFISDTAIISTGEVNDEQAFSSSITLDVEAVTDFADLTTPYIEGDEDSEIDLSALSASLIDQDGSEYMSLSLLGIPEGASIGYDDGSGFVYATNNGVDGGTFNGQPSYSWSVEADKLDSLVFLPPPDYAGDVRLTLQAITKDEEPGVFVTSESSFIVGVMPIADGLDFYRQPESNYIGDEDEQIDLDIGAINLDVVGSEKIQVRVTIEASSDPSALSDIENIATIKSNGNSTTFVANGAGGYEAILLLNETQIESLSFNPGGQAFGQFDMTVALSTVDFAIVNGNRQSDISVEQQVNFEIILAAEPDAPLWLTVGDVVTVTGDNVSLNLAIEERNPAPAEQSFVEISSIPVGVTFNVGSANGDNWLVSEAELASLEVSGLTADAITTLTLTPLAELDGEVKTGVVEEIDITVGTPAVSVITSGAFVQPLQANDNNELNNLMVNKLQDILSNQDIDKADSFAQHISENASLTPTTISHNSLDTVVHDSLEY